MRLSKTIVAEREAFAREFFTTNPTATGAALNEEFKKLGKPQMNIARVYALRTEVTKAVVPAVTTDTTTAAIAV